VNLSTNVATGTGINDAISHFDDVRGSIHNDVITGNSGANTLTGGLGHDALNGMSGNDILNMGAANDGADQARGGPGTDTALYNLRTGNLHISLDGVANDGARGERDNVHGDIENVVSGRGNDLLMGNKFDNRLNGGGGHNTLSAANAPRGVKVNLTTHTLTNWGHDVNIGFSNVIGSRFGDIITGNALNNALNGMAGNDTVNGAAGNDFLIGGPGNDHLNGGPGNDGCSAGPGSNVLISC
jgi:Ca2+-binding RTX toxin-like protein